MSFAANTFAQQPYETLPDPQTGVDLYRGSVTFKDLGSFNWQTEGYKNYQPDSEATAYLKQHLSAFQIVVFLGTWCEDSHLLIPQFQKILEAAGYPLDKVNMVAVDRAKTSAKGLEKEYSVQFVPTIILLKEGKERGRIVEGAYPSLEEMLVDIVEMSDQ